MRINSIIIAGKETVHNLYGMSFIFLAIGTFPANSPSFKNPLESKYIICFDFKNKRDCLKYYSSYLEPKILSDLNP